MEPSKSAALICRTCGDTFTHRWSLLRHEKIHAGITYTCAECDKFFSITSNLVRHMKNHHTDSENYVCSICGLTFKRKDTMLAHEATHGESAYRCTVCDKQYSRKDSLQKRMGCCHPICGKKAPHYSCVHCSQSFTQQYNLNRHLKKHSSTDQNGHVCPHCDQLFVRRDTLAKHMKVCESMRSTEAREGRIVSAAIGSATQVLTRGHIDRLHNLQQCSVCNQTFSKKENLQRHMKSTHEKVLFSCARCGKSWSRKDKLDKHHCTSVPTTPTPVTPAERVAKSRSLSKQKEVLSKSPKTKSVLIEAMLSTPSRNTRQILQQKGLVHSAEQQSSVQMGLAVLSDAESAMAALKQKRSTGATQVREQATVVLVGNNVKKARVQNKVCKKLFVTKLKKKVRRANVRENLLRGNVASVYDVKCKIRGLKVSEDWRDKMINYWCNDASHPTTDTTRGGALGGV